MSNLRVSIKNLLVLIFGGLALLVWLPTYKYVTHTYVTQLITEKGGSVHDFASALAAVIAENLMERQREVSLLAQTPFFKNAVLDAPEFKENLERVKDSYPHYTWIGIADLEGTVRTATGNLLRGEKVKDRPWFSHGLLGSYFGDLHGALLLSKVLPSSSSGEELYLIDFSEPLVSPEGELRGVLGIHADWRWMGDVIKVVKPTASLGPRLDILIVNNENRVIYPKHLDGKLRIPDEVGSEQPFLVGNWDDGIEYVSSMVTIGDKEQIQSIGWRVLVRQPTSQTLRDVDSLQSVIQATIFLSVLVFMILLWWGATRISVPLRQLSAHARRIERGADTKPIKIKSMASEVSELAAALHSMASTLTRGKNALAESNTRLEKEVEARTAELERANLALALLARNDELTNLPNRRAANEHLDAEFLTMKRSQNAYCVLMIDVDFFKSINDTHGHAAGDQVLRRVAQSLKVGVRQSDFVSRFGGEEFLIILPNTKLEEGLIVSEKLRAAVESLDIPLVGTVTVSLGLAVSSVKQTNSHTVVKEADRLLYKAKSAGRNRVEFTS